MVDGIDDKVLWEEIGPIIKKAMKHGGGAQQILSKSQAMAATKMIELMMYSDKDDVKLRAAKELLDRSLGKAVERKLSIHGDLSTMSEKELDSEVARLLEEADGGAILDAIIDHKAKALPAKKTKTKKDLIPKEMK